MALKYTLCWEEFLTMSRILPSKGCNKTPKSRAKRGLDKPCPANFAEICGNFFEISPKFAQQSSSAYSRRALPPHRGVKREIFEENFSKSALLCTFRKMSIKVTAKREALCSKMKCLKSF